VVEQWLERCASLLDGFEEEVYRRTSSADGAAPLGSPERRPLDRSR